MADSKLDKAEAGESARQSAGSALMPRNQYAYTPLPSLYPKVSHTVRFDPGFINIGYSVGPDASR